MKFNKIYIELTNICGLSCSFCPTKNFKNQTMSLEFFEKTLKEVSTFTNTITFHMFGDPLVLSNIKEYLDLSYQMSMMKELRRTKVPL